MQTQCFVAVSIGKLIAGRVAIRIIRVAPAAVSNQITLRAQGCPEGLSASVHAVEALGSFTAVHLGGFL